MTDTTQLDAWRGEFGDKYIDRNESLTEVLRMRTRMWAEMLKTTFGAEPESILEVGCNIGLNLRAIDRLCAATLHAVEPNAKARQRVLDDRVVADERLYNATGQKLPFGAGEIDMVFSSGVLIHVHPDDLGTVADEMHRVSNRWILVAEYFSTKPESIPLAAQHRVQRRHHPRRIVCRHVREQRQAQCLRIISSRTGRGLIAITPAIPRL